MAKIGPDDWIEADRRERETARNRLTGFYLAGPLIALPPLASLPIMSIAGEGDYIVLVLGLLWAALTAAAIVFRRKAEIGSMQRSCAFWVAFWSALLGCGMMILAIAFAIGR